MFNGFNNNNNNLSFNFFSLFIYFISLLENHTNNVFFFWKNYIKKSAVFNFSFYRVTVFVSKNTFKTTC